MRSVLFLLAVSIAVGGLDAQAQQRRRTGGGLASLAIFVADPGGTPIPNVLVRLEGAVSKSARVEGGRIAFEELPPGNYRLTFEREGFITLERELTARGGAPIDVKVTLKPAPLPPAPPKPPAAPPKPDVDAEPASFDVPAVFEKEFVGRGGGKVTPLACGSEGSALLLQVKDPVLEHTHDDADEFLYVIGGEGMVRLGQRHESMKAGVLMFVPRGVPHSIVATGRSPLVIVSTRAGEGCNAGGTR